MRDLRTKLDELLSDPDSATLLRYFYDSGALDYRDAVAKRFVDQDRENEVKFILETPMPESSAFT